MPIEPTSVSKTAVREVEKASSSFGSWSSMQGSSTGGKDRPTSNSIWEKAITGAQKLFGSSTSEPNVKEDSRDSEDASEKKLKARGTEQVFDAVPGFGNRGFGRYPASSFGGSAFGSVGTSRAAGELSGESSSGVEFERSTLKSELQAKPKSTDNSGRNIAEADAKDRPLVKDEATEEEAEREERPLASATSRKQVNGSSAQTQPTHPVPVQAANPRVSAQSLQQEQSVASSSAGQQPVQPSGGNPVVSAPVDEQARTAVDDKPSGTFSSNDASNTKRTPETKLTQDSSAKQPSPVVQAKGQVVSEVAKQSQGVPKGANSESVKVAAESNAGSRVREVANTQGGSQPTVSSTVPQGPQAEAKQGAAVDVQPAEKSKATESLGLELGKAKEAVADSVNRAGRQNLTKQAQAAGHAAQHAGPAPVSNEAAAFAAKAMSGEAGGSRMGEGADAGKEGQPLDPQKREASQIAQQRAAQGRAANEGTAQSRAAVPQGESAAIDAKTAQVASQSSGANVSREAAAAAATRIQSPATASKNVAPGPANTSTTGLAGVAGGQNLGAASVNTQGAQQGSSKNRDGGDPAAKQDFNATMKQASSAKAGEKAGGDSAQAFEAKVEAAANRRAEAASKASQTSYVSKTAAEVKETIATLTKSIDRLVTDKSNAMNLKINFEGGGSVNLRVSMDGSSVSTQMQTDVVGLEAAIKANWAELANDWSQKGVKLNTPHFQNSESGKDASFDNANEFASKGDRQANGRSGEGRGQSSARSSGTRGFDSSSAEGGKAASTEAGEVVSDTELKTYA